MNLFEKFVALLDNKAIFIHTQFYTHPYNLYSPQIQIKSPNKMMLKRNNKQNCQSFRAP